MKSYLLAARRCRLRTGIVSALGAHHHLAVSLGLGLDANLAKAAVPPGIGRLVADGVLIPDVARNRPADFVHFIQRLGEECDPARALCNDLQRTLGALGMFFVPQNSDGIHRRAVLFLQLLHGLLQSLVAGVILAVGHHEQNFFLEARIPLQMLGRGDDGIVEGSASAGVNFFQRFLQLEQVVGEILVEIIFVVEVHDEDFVLGIAGRAPG